MEAEEAQMAKIEDSVEWLTRTRADILQQIELMEAGKNQTSEGRDSGRVDTTEETLIKSRRFLAELDAHLDKHALQGS
jgi:hypothetical protein